MIWTSIILLYCLSCSATNPGWHPGGTWPEEWPWGAAWPFLSATPRGSTLHPGVVTFLISILPLLNVFQKESIAGKHQHLQIDLQSVPMFHCSCYWKISLTSQSRCCSRSWILVLAWIHPFSTSAFSPHFFSFQVCRTGNFLPLLRVCNPAVLQGSQIHSRLGKLVCTRVRLYFHSTLPFCSNTSKSLTFLSFWLCCLMLLLRLPGINELSIKEQRKLCLFPPLEEVHEASGKLWWCLLEAIPGT